MTATKQTFNFEFKYQNNVIYTLTKTLKNKTYMVYIN